MSVNDPHATQRPYRLMHSEITVRVVFVYTATCLRQQMESQGQKNPAKTTYDIPHKIRSIVDENISCNVGMSFHCSS